MTIRRAVVALILALGLAPARAATVRVGVYENEPLVFAGSDGRPRGIYIDLLEHIASQEGWELDYVRGSWEECLGRMDRGEVDLQTSIAYSEERAQRYEFSRETVLANWGQVYAREGSGIESVLDLHDKRVAVIAGDVYEQEFERLVERFGVRCRYVVLADYTEMLATVAEGRTDAGVTNRLHVAQLAREGGLETTPILFAPVELRFAAPKGQGTELLAALDRHLAALKREDGSAYHQSLDRWLGGVSASVFPEWLPWALVLVGVVVAAFVAGGAVLGALVRRRTAELRERNVELGAEIAERHRAEEAQRKAERERAIVLDTVSEVVTCLDRDLRVVWANRAAAELAGMSVEEMAGRHCHEIWYQSAERCPDCAVARAIETGQPQQAEVTSADGRAFAVRAYPVRDEGGAIVGTVELSLDITQRKRAEQRHLEAEREKELILGSIGELVSFQDTQMRILWANRAASETVGLRPEELIGRYCYDTWCHRDAPGEDCPVRRAMASGEPEQGEVTTPDGRVWDIRGYPVRGDDGQIAGAVEVTLDLTARKLAEEQLRESEEKYRTLVEMFPHTIAIFQDRKAVFVNPAATRMFGCESVDELVGRDTLSAIAASEQERIAGFVRARARGDPNVPDHYYTVFTRLNGEEFPGEVFITPITYRGRPAWQLLVLDVTARKQAEEALRHEARLRSTLVDASPAFIAAIAPDGKTLMMNESMLLVLGYTLEEVVDTDYLATFVPERERERLGRLFHRLTDLKSPALNENHVLTKEGRERLVEWHGRPVLDENDELEFFFGIGIDITERKRAEEALRREASFRASIIEESPAFIATLGIDGRIRLMNRAMLNATGYTWEEVEGRDYLTTFVPEREREAVAAIYARLQEHRVSGRGENHIVTRDGRELLVEWHGRASFTPDGEPDYILGVGVDVTEQRRSQGALRASEERYRGIVEDAADLICRFRTDGTLTFVNGAYCRYFGKGPAELEGRSFYLLIPEADRAAARERLAAISADRPVVSHEHRATTADGRVRWQHWINRAILDDEGNVVEVQAVGRDVTPMREQRERLEELVTARTAELQEANAELEAFAYSVSHDLRAPLRAMEGFGLALVDDYGDRLDDEGRDYARSIARAARKMDVLIRDLLAYSRVGRVEMHLAPTSLDDVVEESLMQLATEVQGGDADIRIDRPLPVVTTHHATLVQAVTNLLSNAVKFVAPGEQSRVRLWAERRQGGVRLWVEDHGIGIEPEHTERIFTVFERLHSIDAYPGTGIGLAIVRRGIERMGGRVGVESEPGKGSRFWLELPEAGPDTAPEA